MTSPLLGLETSGPVASVAVSVGARVVARRTLGVRGRHAARLLPAVEEALSDAGLGRRDLAGVVVGTGPGSFTGVRVAAAAGKGIAHALGIPLYAVSSLVAAAWAERVPAEAWEGWPPETADGSETTPPDPPERVILFDARGDRLFCGTFRLDDAGVEVLDPPSFRHLPELLAEGATRDLPHCGSGALRHRAALLQDRRRVLPPPWGRASADGILLEMSSSRAPGPLDRPWEWEPDYLRDTGAVRGRAG